MTWHSQHGQDELLDRELFHGRKGGVFVDVGAFDGVEFSNTLHLEQELGWKGLCIEPNPLAFGKLRANRTCHCVQAAAWEKRCKLQFRQVKSKQSQVEMLSGVIEAMDERHESRIAREPGDTEVIEVQAVTVHDAFVEHLLRDQLKATIDYLSIDVENAELQVLKGVDFNRVRVNVVSFEVEHYDTGDDLRRTAEAYDHLTRHGFRHWQDVGEDRIFVSNGARWSWSL